MISLIHPSRGRPEKAKETLENWLKKSSGTIAMEHLLSIDESDPKKDEYKKLFPKAITNNNTCVVEATNAAAKLAVGHVYIYLSDDFDCPDMWDVLIQNEFMFYNHDPRLLKVDDCLQKFDIPVMTIPIMNAELYSKLGYFFHPEYKSMFCDEQLFWICKNNGWILNAPELKFPHLHCSIGKADNDETYKRSSANWDQGKVLFAKHKALNFPL